MNYGINLKGHWLSDITGYDQMKIFWMTPSKNYKGFCYKKGFLQGYQLSREWWFSTPKKTTKCHFWDKIKLSQSNLLIKRLKNVQCPFTTNLMFYCVYEPPRPSFIFLFSYKDKLSRSQNSDVTSLSCHPLDFSRHVFIKLRKYYNIGKLTSLKLECNLSLTADHMICWYDASVTGRIKVTNTA